ncbi:SH3 domain-containing protein [Actinomadura oligospora]|uniref:SH3 domain-containing protein n=1 Tax=Actinomadura oligospora TaxID=111804 RepID=UPI00047A0178|nr:SH3 domain-containing protein [Actinomadura oligospora]
MKTWQTAALAVPLITFSMLAPGRAEASEPASSASVPTCHWKVVHVHRHHVLNVRSGPGLRYRVVGHLRHGAKRIPGACHKSRRGWVHLHRPRGWASGHYLRKVH